MTHFTQSTLRRGYRGFTLIELMVTVAVIGILTAIAYPSYLTYIQQSRRTAAKSALADASQYMERNMTQYNCYNFKTATGCAGSGGTALAAEDLPVDSSGYYTIGFAANSPTNSTYLLTATPVAKTSQATDVCNTFTLDNKGVRGVANGTNTDPVNCWGR